LEEKRSAQMGIKRLNLPRKRLESGGGNGLFYSEAGFWAAQAKKKTLEEFPKGCCAGSSYCDWLKKEHEKTLQALTLKVFHLCGWIYE